MNPLKHMSQKTERFCQLMAVGTMHQWEAYREAYHSVARQSTMANEAIRLLKKPDVQARIDAIRRPVIEKVRKQFQYSLEDALDDCMAAETLARTMMQPGIMLQAAKLKAQLAKLLVSVSETRGGGPLDKASTDELVELLREQRRRKALDAVEQAPVAKTEVKLKLVG